MPLIIFFKSGNPKYFFLTLKNMTVLVIPCGVLAELSPCLRKTGVVAVLAAYPRCCPERVIPKVYLLDSLPLL